MLPGRMFLSGFVSLVIISELQVEFISLLQPCINSRTRNLESSCAPHQAVVLQVNFFFYLCPHVPTLWAHVVVAELITELFIHQPLPYMTIFSPLKPQKVLDLSY